MNDIEQHDSSWNDRLQDLLDGDVDASDRSAIESHLSTCKRCRAQYAQLKRLDTALAQNLDAPQLDASFDRQVFARIEALDTRERELARRHADRELEQNLTMLARHWRRGLAYLIGGAIAGIALAFAFMAWADAAGVADKLLGLSNGIGAEHADSLRTLLTVLMGAAVGGGVSRWLANTMD